jgi:hypothetical protein
MTDEEKPTRVIATKDRLFELEPDSRASRSRGSLARLPAPGIAPPPETAGHRRDRRRRGDPGGGAHDEMTPGRQGRCSARPRDPGEVLQGKTAGTLDPVRQGPMEAPSG